MQLPFRLGQDLLPLVGGDGPQFREELVFRHSEASRLRGPVGQEAHHSEGWRAQELDNRADALERLQDLLGLTRSDAVAVS